MFSKEKLFDPVSGLSLAVFRIMFGLTMIWSAGYYLWNETYVVEYFIKPDFHPTFPFFGWIKAWPELWMAQVHMVVMGILALMITIGLFYRFAIIAFTLMFSYIFLIDQALYLNHYYLVIVVGILMSMLPTDRALALDARRRDEQVPLWAIWAFRAQTEIVLLYAGFVKLKYDWLHLEPLGSWMRTAAVADGHIFGSWVQQDWFVAIGAYGVIALHLVGAPLLLFKKTRIWVFVVYVMFHLMNSYTFVIGIFPYFTIAATLVFFDPDWPKRWLEKLKVWRAQKAQAPVDCNPQKTLLRVVIVWLIFQALFPMRVYLYPGDSAWTSEGHTFSWRMLLDSRTPYAFGCKIHDPASGQDWEINPFDHLTQRQIIKTAVRPSMILQFAKYLEEKKREEGFADVEVYCSSFVSMNGRKPAPLINPDTDLTKEDWGLMPEDWILPMNEPFVHWKDRKW